MKLGFVGRPHSKLLSRLHHGLFEPLVMFFGLCNSPATFQTMMNDILRPFINRNEAICYMDDILIYSASLADHQRITWEILQTLHSYKLFLRPEKCKFECREVDYLRLVISKDHVAMDPIKVQGVTDWPQPTKVKDVQSFIGFVNFYRRFIWNFSEIARPLHVLTWKSKNWSWGAAEQQAFDALKNAITSAPTLAFPSKSGLFQLECDASNFATGAVLLQQQEDGVGGITVCYEAHLRSLVSWVRAYCRDCIIFGISFYI